jgi:hypothetical protein
MLPHDKFIYNNSPLPYFVTGGGDSDDPTLPVEITSIIQAQKGECNYEEGSDCTTSSTHKVNYKNAVEPVVFAWVCTGGTIIGDTNQQTVEVETTSDQDVTFTLECTITDDKASTDTDSRDFTHDRILNPIEIVDISDLERAPIPLLKELDPDFAPRLTNAVVSNPRSFNNSASVTWDSFITCPLSLTPCLFGYRVDRLIHLLCPDTATR